MAEKPLMYFGHPINFYNTTKEAELIRAIETRFPEYSVENPNQPFHQEMYKKWKAEKGSGMKYYFEELLPRMAAGTFLAFEDKMFGAGVFGEAESIHNQRKPIWEISLDSIITPMVIDTSRMLSIEETRKRVYGNN